jgi:uncharacterized protein YbjT (DUF2867 family)
MHATIFHPAYFIQYDAKLKDAILQRNIYPMPIGNIGISMIDTRDLAEVAASILFRREQAAGLLPRETVEVAGPVFTGEAIAGIWSKVFGQSVRYAGDDLAAFEQQLRSFAPGWLAYDLRQMMGRSKQTEWWHLRATSSG